ncbi:hypothetical protein Ddye_009479 [Dipteronia dyeriana]|uniref:Uncharacterized protein n=1 Tax=Dipteronia dyeriana TaxID=168575 RepID=A0AAE0CMA5_9ROSI|nr:hypothetical protein Ddye_009479 [Dipteronia dyeriana]
MSQILKQPEVNLLEQLMPYKQNELSSTQFNLAVQVSYFDCGGMTVCVCFRHVLADAVAALNFIKSWATVACDGGNHLIENVVFDCTSCFPPQDNLESYAQKLHDSSRETVTKRFVFEGSKISALREKIGNRPTRYEALFALMWGAVTGAAKGEKDGHREFVLDTAVNLRKRLNPPIPEQCIGNILVIVRGSLPTEETIDYKSYVEGIRELMSLVNEDHVKKASPYGWLLNRVKNDHGVGRNKTMRSFSISSCGRLPLYEADFGWGKPIWATIVARQVGDNIFGLLDTSDGQGMEGWVVMSKEEMDQFEQGPLFLLMLLLIQAYHHFR